VTPLRCVKLTCLSLLVSTRTHPTQVVQKGKGKYVNIASKMCEFNDDFRLYLCTRLPNPHFSPEDQAKTIMVDFTVTQKGLEEQLLGE
jgi:dynein heavy chain, axonemal